jgi:hypothetical protein
MRYPAHKQPGPATQRPTSAPGPAPQAPHPRPAEPTDSEAPRPLAAMGSRQQGRDQRRYPMARTALEPPTARAHTSQSSGGSLKTATTCAPLNLLRSPAPSEETRTPQLSRQRRPHCAVTPTDPLRSTATAEARRSMLGRYRCTSALGWRAPQGRHAMPAASGRSPRTPRQPPRRNFGYFMK